MARPAASLEKRQTAAEVSAAAAAYGIPEELLWGMIALGEVIVEAENDTEYGELIEGVIDPLGS